MQKTLSRGYMCWYDIICVDTIFVCLRVDGSVLSLGVESRDCGFRVSKTLVVKY